MTTITKKRGRPATFDVDTAVKTIAKLATRKNGVSAGEIREKLNLTVSQMRTAIRKANVFLDGIGRPAVYRAYPESI